MKRIFLLALLAVLTLGLYACGGDGSDDGWKDPSEYGDGEAYTEIDDEDVTSITVFKNLILLFKESSNTIFRWGKAIFNGIPGKPAPVPISITFCTLFMSIAFTIDILSTKCFSLTSSYSVIPVKFITLFHSTRSS